MSDKVIYGATVVEISLVETKFRSERGKTVGVPTYKVTTKTPEGEVLSVKVKESDARYWFD